MWLLCRAITWEAVGRTLAVGPATRGRNAASRLPTGRPLARNLTITWASASGQPSTLSFDPVDTTGIRLTMTSPAPGTASGF
jgi:hypothetical protein